MRRYSIFVAIFLILLNYNLLFAANYLLERQQSARVLDLINADTAYNLNYTGLGVRIGIVDEAVNPSHHDFLNNLSIFPLINTPIWALNQHGSHVGGIMMSPKDGIGMHGVAYNATLHSVAYLEDYYDAERQVKTHNNTFSVVAFYESAPDMRIVNNSLGTFYYPYGFDKDGNFYDHLANENFFTISGSPALDEHYPQDAIIYAMNNPHVVTVFASGNDGRLSGSIGALGPRYLGLDLANIISVGSLNSDNIIKNNDGSLSMTPLSMSIFSNLAFGMERYTVFAPGSNILAPNASNNGYIEFGGTSMAAPVVSGALALVQQAYPWFTGKQLADAILTTANNNFTAPKYIISRSKHLGEGSTTYNVVTFYSIDGGLPNSLTKEEALRLLREAYDSSENPDDNIENLEYYITNNYYEVVQISKESAFGRGVLDVGKAVQGIALLDVNRLKAANAMSVSELGNQKFALEVFDTQDYSSTFYNDIGEEKWNDDYHIEKFKTTALSGENANALALNGLGAGIIKQGSGSLMLRGYNTYSGPTVIEDGTLGLKPRDDGSGGVLKNSSVVVRPQGTFYSEGGVVNNTIHNSGIVHVANMPDVALTVGNYIQKSIGKLKLEVDADHNTSNSIQAQTAELAGTLEFLLEKDYYKSSTSIVYDVFSSASSVQGSFEHVHMLEYSPTLTGFVSQSSANDVFKLTVARPPHAYSQYATKSADKGVGNALSLLANHAQGDMQTLLTTLDFSSPNGSDVGKALKKLGTHTQHQLAQASLAQHGTQNAFIVQHMLNKKNAMQNSVTNNTKTKDEQSLATDKAQAKHEQSGLAAGTNTQNSWSLWGSVIGSGVWQGESQGFSGWNSSSVGVLLGADYIGQDGISAGIHMSYASRRLEAQDDLDATTDTQSFSVGVHSFISPSSWHGWYVMGQGRIGFENNEHKRIVSFTDYTRGNESEWTDFTGSLLLGGGKSWHMGNFAIGPVAWLEYSFMQRPRIAEDNSNATSLVMEGAYYDSLRTALGVHLSYSKAITENVNLDLNALVTWRHELFNSSLDTTAAFNGYGFAAFESTTPFMGRNTWGARGSLRLSHVKNYFIELQLGAEMSDAQTYGINGALQVGYSF